MKRIIATGVGTLLLAAPAAICQEAAAPAETTVEIAEAAEQLAQEALQLSGGVPVYVPSTAAVPGAFGGGRTDAQREGAPGRRL